ncbi:hypothetical protein AXG93_1054s1570 [Marchantia polymorpha subsp. ruderalis]|uniref:Uncharacterized protein n=1 Tax=Marchantia polymorpha subsp. ruderalis TaxID=1480154 RepID=A0A176WP28_MARPO|nr:hypothetical protein AXG93_1054s1570 [Marchantia polymorpha subsp. ruderalis]
MKEFAGPRIINEASKMREDLRTIGIDDRPSCPAVQAAGDATDIIIISASHSTESNMPVENEKRAKVAKGLHLHKPCNLLLVQVKSRYRDTTSDCDAAPSCVIIMCKHPSFPDVFVLRHYLIDYARVEKKQAKASVSISCLSTRRMKSLSGPRPREWSRARAERRRLTGHSDVMTGTHDSRNLLRRAYGSSEVAGVSILERGSGDVLVARADSGGQI